MAKRKKADAGNSKKERFETLMADLKGRYPGKIMRAEDYTAPWSVKRCPTGLLNLDLATNGGLPCGGMTVIVAKPNMGKNWLLLQVIKKQQEIYGDDCRFGIIGTEIPFDKTQAREAGVKVAFSEDEIEALDESKKKLSKKGEGLTEAEKADLRTQVGEFVIVPPSTAEDAFQMCAEMVASNTFNIVAIDSFGAILTAGDMDKDIGEASRVGGPAGLNTQLMHRLYAAFAPDEHGEPNLTCMIGTNQVRDNLKAVQSFMKQQKESGGWALKHGRFVTIELSRTGWLTKSKTDKTRTGKQMKWEITKQKAGGRDGHEGTYDFLFDGLHHDRADMAVELGLACGVVEKDGNTYVYQGVKVGVGRAKAATFFDEKPDILAELEDEILRANGVSYLL